MDKNNPFLNDEEEDKEEKVYIRKPFQKEILTENQKARNLRGIKKCMEDLKKVIPPGRVL